MLPCSLNMKPFLKRWLVTAVGAAVAAQIVPGIHYDTVGGLLLAALLLGILNAVVRPILVVLALPVVLLSLGLFLLVINALLLYWVGHLKGFHVDSFMDAFWGSLIISVVSLVVNSMTKPSNAGPRNPPAPPAAPTGRRDDGKGPIIDV